MRQIHSPLRAYLTAVTVNYASSTALELIYFQLSKWTSHSKSTLKASDEILEANNNNDDFEVDIELFSPMESMKSLIAQVIATKRPNSGPLVSSLAKRSSEAAADESQPTRVACTADARSFDPSQPISCTDTTAEAAELDLPSIVHDSDAKGPK